ncbi:hypothetical protein D6774_00465 [Candidatus Woesearchaeota archaeon]|nr:MAG: hypothetical protein D6774_00465 [Candidatus Woesearchaeota archaeon]
MTLGTIDDFVEINKRKLHIQNNSEALLTHISYALTYLAFHEKPVRTPQELQNMALSSIHTSPDEIQVYRILQQAIDKQYSWRSEGTNLEIYDPSGKRVLRIPCPYELLKRD